MQLALKRYELQLKHTFRISREAYKTQETLVAILSYKGHSGFGEATANPYYQVSFDSMRTEIEAVRAAIEAFEFQNPENFHTFLQGLGLSNFALCALDLAANDLYGKLLGKPLYTIWGTNIHQYPITNFTIGIDSIDKMIDKMKEQPWPIYKIKLGTQEDVEIVRALREHSKAVFRVDANCAWTVEETLANARNLADLGVEFIEQPLAADRWAEMKKVKEQCVLPVIADESCIVETDVERCAECFDGINIKLTKCGGLTPALRMIRKGRALGLKIMTGCMTESSIGISAIAQLLPQLDYVDMDGAMLLAKDIAEGVKIDKDAKVIFPKENGSGIKMKV